MKINNIKKYILMIIFLFIGLFGISSNVSAKEVVCDYSFDFTYEHTTSSGMIENANGTAEFQLIFNSVIESTGYSTYKLKVTGNYSIQPRYAFDGLLYFNNDPSTCPTVLVYQRRTGITGNINTNKFYILSDVVEPASDLINACNGKGVDVEVLSGYRCGNIIGQISGTKVKTACDETDLKAISDKKNEIFRANVETAFYNELNRLNNEASSFTSTTTKAICDEYENKFNTTLFTEPFSKFKSESDNLLNNLECEITESVSQELSNYSMVGNTNVSYETKLQNYTNTLSTTFRANLNNCHKNATDMTEEEKEEEKEKTKDLIDDLKNDMNEANSKIVDEYLKYIDKITSINLGTPIEIDCRGLLGDDLLNLISEILGYVQIAAPILLIVLGSVDFGQAVLSDDKEALKKATSKFVKRAIICVVIFFAPLILKYLLSFLNDMGKDPLCGIK